MCITNFYFPKEFLEDLKRAYTDYTNITLSSKSIMKSIYLVSLCAKFYVKRRRLVYRDIFDQFEENNVHVIPRIDQWIELTKNSEQICKIMTVVNHHYDKNKNRFKLIDPDMMTNHNICEIHKTIFSGELDYLDLTDGTLVDIKCSSCDFKLEWFIQLLTYYSLLIKTKQQYVIKRLAIINIFTGVYFSYDVQDNYNVDGLIMYIGKYIENNFNALRKEFDIPNNFDVLRKEFDIPNNLNHMLNVPTRVYDIKINSLTLTPIDLVINTGVEKQKHNEDKLINCQNEKQNNNPDDELPDEDIKVMGNIFKNEKIVLKKSSRDKKTLIHSDSDTLCCKVLNVESCLNDLLSFDAFKSNKRNNNKLVM